MSKSDLKIKQPLLWKQADLSVLQQHTAFLRTEPYYISLSGVVRHRQNRRVLSSLNSTLFLPFQQKSTLQRAKVLNQGVSKPRYCARPAATAVKYVQYSFIHSVFCLTTGPKSPLKRFLHIVFFLVFLSLPSLPLSFLR